MADIEPLFFKETTPSSKIWIVLGDSLYGYDKNGKFLNLPVYSGQKNLEIMREEPHLYEPLDDIPFDWRKDIAKARL